MPVNAAAVRNPFFIVVRVFSFHNFFIIVLISYANHTVPSPIELLSGHARHIGAVNKGETRERTVAIVVVPLLHTIV